MLQITCSNSSAPEDSVFQLTLITRSGTYLLAWDSLIPQQIESQPYVRFKVDHERSIQQSLLSRVNSALAEPWPDAGKAGIAALL
ncbi:MAG: hypothetical protein HC842_08180, partial [Cytophagales bacterium]|nr:hypothetical protein [Cytophagales bacterium]